MSNEQNATPIDDQLIVITAIARAAGYDDGAAWIEQQATAFVERELADSEPRKCVQTMNRFEYPLAFPCSGDARLHGTPEEDCGKKERLCRHHVPLYASLSSEPSRTEAVKEIVHRIRASADHYTISMKEARLLVVAIADAEHESAHYKDELAAATKHERVLEEQVADCEGKLVEEHEKYYLATMSDAKELRAHTATKRQLAAAEKRAKDAEARIAFHHCKPPLGNPTREEAMALVDEFQDECDRRVTNERTLTRKLATALEGLEQVAFLVDHFRQCPHNTMRNPHERESECLAQVARDTIAAIDAPAGEEREHWLIYANGIARPLGCTYDFSDPGYHNNNLVPQPVLTCPVCHPIAPPPEPASAQAERCSAHICLIHQSDDPCTNYKHYKSRGLCATCFNVGCRPPESVLSVDDRAANAQVPANGAHPFGACCPMKVPPFCPCPCHTNSVAEPVTNVLLDALTTPANAQGSEFPDAEFCGDIATRADPPSAQRFTAEEARPLPMVLHCPKCKLQHIDVDDDTGNWATTRLHRKHLCKPSDGGCGHVWAPFNYSTVGVKRAPSSALPFTAEEARERDLCSDENERVVATLRHYADLLERDDALERAAEEVLAVLARLHVQPDGTNLIPLFEAEKRLRAVLAQRAGKAE